MSRIAGARSRSVDEKLTECIQHIKKMLAQGYTLGKMGAQDKDRNIVVRDILRVYRLNSHLSGMLMAFDFNKRVTLERVARERDRYCIDQSEARRMREDFKGGQLTEAAMVRILGEARDDMRSRQPDIVLQPMQTSLEKFKYLMR